MKSQEAFSLIDFSAVPGLLDWIAFGLGALGIGFTVIQLIRSKGALKAAAKALTETRDILMRNQLVSVLPAFEEISKSIDSALRADDRELLQDGLGRFSYRAHEAMALLTDSTSGHEALINEIAITARSSSLARSNIFSDPTSPVALLAGEAASSIRNLAPQIGGAAVSIRNDPGKVKKNA